MYIHAYYYNIQVLRFILKYPPDLNNYLHEIFFIFLL